MLIKKRKNMIKKISLAVLITFFVAVGIGIAVVKYNQHQNLALMFAEGLDGRLIAHKANHQGKLESIFASGARSFELDLVFRQQENQGYFEVGHDEEEWEGKTFESYLKRVHSYKIKKIWVDIKNIQDSNMAAALHRLEYLDSIYGIKAILVLESSTTSAGFKAFSDAGYHTTYYLPTEAIEKLLQQNNKQAIALEVQRIHDLSIQQSLRAVSFTASLYPFVKTYLEPALANQIVYHTWNIIKFKEFHALEKLKETAIFKDARVKTIIYSYHYIY